MPGMQNTIPQTAFLRGSDFRRTYNERVLPYEGIRKKLRQFMHTKRLDPLQPWGSSDKVFVPSAPLGQLHGLRHAHLTPDLSIVYRVINRTILLYGFYTHDDLGTGQPPKIPKQKIAANKFQTTQFG